MKNRHARIQQGLAGSGGWILTLCLVLALPTSVLADGSSLWRSALIPGAGQAHEGNYKKAAIFAGVAIASAAGLIVSSVNYNQSVEEYRRQKNIYLSYPEALASGQIVSIEQINQTYQDMSDAFDQGDTRLAWRNAFLVALVGTYALNIVDVLVSKPHDIETASRISIESDGGRVLVLTRLRF